MRLPFEPCVVSSFKHRVVTRAVAIGMKFNLIQRSDLLLQTPYFFTAPAVRRGKSSGQQPRLSNFKLRADERIESQPGRHCFQVHVGRCTDHNAMMTGLLMPFEPLQHIWPQWNASNPVFCDALQYRLVLSRQRCTDQALLGRLIGHASQREQGKLARRPGNREAQPSKTTRPAQERNQRVSIGNRAIKIKSCDCFHINVTLHALPPGPSGGACVYLTDMIATTAVTQQIAASSMGTSLNRSLLVSSPLPW